MLKPNEIVAEHEALRAHVAELRTLITTAPAEAGRADFTRRLAAATARLRDRLRAHFALEERGGYLDAVIAVRPGVLATVDKLKRQHADLLGEADRLTASLHTPAPVPTDAAGQVAHLLDHLTTHEIEENELFQETVIDDLGAGD
jgi:hypothetical protein